MKTFRQAFFCYFLFIPLSFVKIKPMKKLPFLIFCLFIFIINYTYSQVEILGNEFYNSKNSIGKYYLFTSGENDIIKFYYDKKQKTYIVHIYDENIKESAYIPLNVNLSLTPCGYFFDKNYYYFGFPSSNKLTIYKVDKKTFKLTKHFYVFPKGFSIPRLHAKSYGESTYEQSAFKTYSANVSNVQEYNSFTIHNNTLHIIGIKNFKKYILIQEENNEGDKSQTIEILNELNLQYKFINYKDETIHLLYTVPYYSFGLNVSDTSEISGTLKTWQIYNFEGQLLKEELINEPIFNTNNLYLNYDIEKGYLLQCCVDVESKKIEKPRTNFANNLSHLLTKYISIELSLKDKSPLIVNVNYITSTSIQNQIGDIENYGNVSGIYSHLNHTFFNGKHWMSIFDCYYVEFKSQISYNTKTISSELIISKAFPVAIISVEIKEETEIIDAISINPIPGNLLENQANLFSFLYQDSDKNISFLYCTSNGINAISTDNNGIFSKLDTNFENYKSNFESRIITSSSLNRMKTSTNTYLEFGTCYAIIDKTTNIKTKAPVGASNYFRIIKVNL